MPNILEPLFIVSVTPGAAFPTPLADTDNISIWTNSILVNPSNFTSPDSNPREAILTVTFPGQAGKQTTTVPFRGKANPPFVAVDPKYLNKLLYLGPKSYAKGITLSLIESNDNTRSALSDAQNFFSTASSLIPSGLPVPVGPILGLVGNILGVIRANVQDDQETYASIGVDASTQVLTVIVSKNGTNYDVDAILKLALNVYKLPPAAAVDPKGEVFTIFVSDLSLVGFDATVQVNQTVIYNSKHPAPSTSVPQTQNQLAQIIQSQMQTFNLEATSGTQAASVSTAIKTDDENLFSRVDLNKQFLFNISGKTAVVPLTLSLSLNPAEVSTTDVVNAVQSAATLAQGLGATIPPAVSALQKAVPSAIGLLSELRPSDLSLLSFNGVLLLLDDGVVPPVVASGSTVPPANAGHLFLQKTKGQRLWTGTITSDVTYGVKSDNTPQKVGTMSATITVVGSPVTP